MKLILFMLATAVISFLSFCFGIYLCEHGYDEDE